MPTPQADGSSHLDDRLPVYVLAGGRSRRYGSDKARAELEGVPLLVRVADTLRPLASSVTVVAALAGQYADLGLRTIGDRVTGCGPIGGLLTAVEDSAASDWIIISACDWLGLRLEWVSTLMARRRPGAEAVVYRSAQYEPLLGLYHRSIRPVLRRRIDAQRFKMQDLLREIETEAAPLPGDWDRALNVNTPRKEGASSEEPPNRL